MGDGFWHCYTKISCVTVYQMVNLMKNPIKPYQTTIFLWVSYGFTTFSYGFTTFSYGFPTSSYGFSPFSDLHQFCLRSTWWPRRPKPQDLLIIDLSDMLSLHGIPAPSASHGRGNIGVGWKIFLPAKSGKQKLRHCEKQTNRFVRI